jgi:translation initiation factor 3 subunit K
LRDNYTVECVGFEDAVRNVVIRGVKAAFRRIGKDRLSTYLDLSGDGLNAYVEKLGWSTDASTGVISIPSNPDNQIESTVVQESIQLPQLLKVITHAQTV